MKDKQALIKTALFLKCGTASVPTLALIYAVRKDFLPVVT